LSSSVSSRVQNFEILNSMKQSGQKFETVSRLVIVKRQIIVKKQNMDRRRSMFVRFSALYLFGFALVASNLISPVASAQEKPPSVELLLQKWIDCVDRLRSQPGLRVQFSERLGDAVRESGMYAECVTDICYEYVISSDYNHWAQKRTLVHDGSCSLGSASLGALQIFNGEKSLKSLLISNSPEVNNTWLIGYPAPTKVDAKKGERGIASEWVVYPRNNFEVTTWIPGRDQNGARDLKQFFDFTVVSEDPDSLTVELRINHTQTRKSLFSQSHEIEKVHVRFSKSSNWLPDEIEYWHHGLSFSYLLKLRWGEISGFLVPVEVGMYPGDRKHPWSLRFTLEELEITDRKFVNERCELEYYSIPTPEEFKPKYSWVWLFFTIGTVLVVIAVWAGFFRKK